MLKTDDSAVDRILASRTERAKRQEELITKYACSLICFTLNIPGPVKDTPLYRAIYDEGLKLLHKALKTEDLDVVYQCSYHRDTGPEAYICVDADASVLKRMSVGIEESHPMGRLFDMDVFSTGRKPVKRTQLGFDERKCLVCGGSYHVCRRSNNHSLEELRASILCIVQGYFETDKSNG